MPRIDADPPLIELRVTGWNVWCRDPDGRLQSTTNRYFFTEDAWAEAQALTIVNGRVFVAVAQYDWSALVTPDALHRSRDAGKLFIDPLDSDEPT